MEEYSKDCSVIAFYGITPSNEAVATVYGYVLDWFASYGRTADAASIDGPGHSGKMGSFQRADAKLKRAGFDGVVGFSLVSTLPNAMIPMSDYIFIAELSFEEGFFFASARCSSVPLTKQALLPFAESISHALKPEYGIGYIRESNLGPTLYAIGLVEGLGLEDEDYLESLNISFWTEARELHIWRQGILRDVYPWNFLTVPQLSRPVNGVPLEEWIVSKPGRGKLSRVSEGAALWEVDAAELPEVRRALWHAGNLYNWPKHVDGAGNHPYAAQVQKLWS